MALSIIGLSQIWRWAMRRDATGLACIIILAGMMLRLAYVVLPMITGRNIEVGDGGEALNVAMSLAAGRGFADPYFTGSGPTAHLMPTQPLIAGGVFALFGESLPAASIMLTLIALTEVGCAYYILFRIGLMLEIDAKARIIALVFLCFVPIYMGIEAGGFRYWDGGIALLLGLLGLYNVLAMENRVTTGGWQELKSSLLVSMILFVNPIIGGAVAVCHAVCYMTRFGIKDCIRAGIIGFATFTIVILPWVVRNYQTFDRFILFRDNVGLELAIANHPNAINTGPFEYWSRLHVVHPLYDGQGRSDFLRYGEVVYFDRLKSDAISWIFKSPKPFMKVTGNHIFQMIVPPTWHFSKNLGPIQVALVTLINIMGVISIIHSLVKLSKKWMYPAIMVICILLGYGMFQPVSRYYYPMYILMAMCAGGVWNIFRWPDRRIALKPVAHQAT